VRNDENDICFDKEKEVKKSIKKERTHLRQTKDDDIELKKEISFYVS
jgi:hypothetical protein